MRFAAWASKKSAWARNIGFLDLAKGFSAAMKEETDFRIEARNFAQVKVSLTNSQTKVKIPHVYRKLSNAKILVIEYMEGVSVKSGAAILDERGIDRLEVKRPILQGLFRMIGEFGFSFYPNVAGAFRSLITPICERPRRTNC